MAYQNVFTCVLGGKLALTFLWKRVRDPGWTEYRRTKYLKTIVARPISGSTSSAVPLQSSVNAIVVSNAPS